MQHCMQPYGTWRNISRNNTGLVYVQCTTSMYCSVEPTVMTSSLTNQSVSSGQTVSFNCSATSDSTTPITFVWFINGSEIHYKQNDINASCGSSSWLVIFCGLCALIRIDVMPQVGRQWRDWKFCMATINYALFHAAVIKSAGFLCILVNVNPPRTK